ncbi:MAG: L-seryl-tRNA(Sec) selenium transferase [Proteobacteria bacterium]|nr:L-seryl-tRNA(Sec) selenium transferase [Pseudomonadota bacterium]MBU1686364.1 L-seryl-tRNA(Sec) selenium transferase [Pseudomonadota bacterium]
MPGESPKTGSISPAACKLLQAIPKVDDFLGVLTDSGHPVTTRSKNIVRQVLEECRQAILAGDLTDKNELAQPKLIARFEARLAARNTPNFKRVINATGVVIHTNLGRSVLPDSAMAWINRVGAGYSNLEFDLTTGRRGSRYSLVEELLCELTGAEAALVVNNNAAAVLLSLETLAKGREVVVSRGQLVEIGGSFRIPDVMARSGATLIEVGATNRTHLRDYEAAITENTALLLKVHTSNYRIIGFSSEVPLPDLVTLAGRHDLPVMEDLGSGCLIDLSRFGLPREPTVGEVVASGADVVTFSGDKLLGGPQAGIILGRKEIVERIKKNPLNRALRIDKFTLAGLEAVLRIYGDQEDALKIIPTLAMLSMPIEKIKARAQKLIRQIKKPLTDHCFAVTISAFSRVGGGALPEQDLPTVAVALTPLNRSVNDLEKSLREYPEPVIGRIEKDQFLLDMRTVADHEINQLATTILAVLGTDR